MSLAHSHPPSHIIRNTKENQLLLRRLLRICVYIYICKYFHTLSYILSYIFICFPISSCIWFLYLLPCAPMCFAILSHPVLYIFPCVLIFLLYIPRDFPIQNVQIGSNIFGSREHGIIIPIGIPYGAFFSALLVALP